MDIRQPDPLSSFAEGMNLLMVSLTHTSIPSGAGTSEFVHSVSVPSTSSAGPGLLNSVYLWSVVLYSVAGPQTLHPAYKIVHLSVHS